MKALREFTKAVALIATLLMAIVAASGTAGAQLGQTGSSAGTWNFLANSYWYVPPANLLALLSSTASGGTVNPVSDQTVFYFQSYQGGYFWGHAATFFTVDGQSTGPNCFQMVGSVTPQGTVNITFTPTAGGPPTTGLGTMRFIALQWTIENQMSTSVNEQTITHWAYMIQCKPGQACNKNLPGTSLTISQMLAPCE